MAPQISETDKKHKNEDKNNKHTDNRNTSTTNNKKSKSSINGDFVKDKTWTPLHEACLKKSHNVVCSLIQEGADINATTSDGITPLHVAAKRGDYNIVEILIASGISQLPISNDGCSPIDYCSGKSDSCDAIKEKLLAIKKMDDEQFAVPKNINNSKKKLNTSNFDSGDGDLTIDEDDDKNNDNFVEPLPPDNNYVPNEKDGGGKKGRKRNYSDRKVEDKDDNLSSNGDTTSTSEDNCTKKFKSTKESSSGGEDNTNIERNSNSPNEKKVTPIRIRLQRAGTEDRTGQENSNDKMETSTPTKKSRYTPRSRRQASVVPEDFYDESSSETRVTRAKARRSNLSFEDGLSNSRKRRSYRSSTVGFPSGENSKSASPAPSFSMDYSDIETPSGSNDTEELQVAQPHSTINSSGPSAYVDSIVYTLFDKSYIDSAITIEDEKFKRYEESLKEESVLETPLPEYTKEFLTFTKKYKQREDYLEEEKVRPIEIFPHLPIDIQHILTNHRKAYEDMKKRQQVEKDRFILTSEREYLRSLSRSQCDPGKHLSIVRVIAENHLYNPQHFDKDHSEWIPPEGLREKLIEKKYKEAQSGC
ncbi:Ankyrin repeat and Ankyrin repeat-containing domain-containing protein [Strongyloides ratti]|uniref:Ankyrin repeat and Ankyrin repeat-containing domain-containing protein n=1 Tax=Strongyloides ratti TaxID=34506 RepID=A0A090L806_STRRB|nr:Ankyrin repeat and Ankyrin repeat-containing domain-containing protein [Strongyloides ratti]CEF65936.1 Ankyrin repeat and Ankyrin repeat-containing domain-containing protein [Strongyloides ratti]